MLHGPRTDIDAELKRVDAARQAGATDARIKPPSKQLVVDWVEAAVSKLKDKPKLIRKAFVVTGIANALNSAEDHLIKRDDASDVDSDEDEFYGFDPAEVKSQVSDYSDYSEAEPDDSD